MTQLQYGEVGAFGLSYSRLETMHSCPRKHELANVLGLSPRVDSVTFSYGHAVAAGIQSYLQHFNIKLAVAECCKFYTFDWLDAGSTSEQRGKKSIAYAVQAVHNFVLALESTLPNELEQLREYELAYLGDRPAVELQFQIVAGEYTYEGHVDLILQHKVSKQYRILELKTTSFTSPHPAQYANSNQALSYSIVLDAIVGHGVANYEVTYLVYSSSKQEWLTFNFPKSATMRLDWLNNLQRDIAVLDMYREHAEQGIPYPTNGSSCYNFFRPCEFFSFCQMDNSSLERIFGNKEAQFRQAEAKEIHFTFTFAEVMQAQIARADSSNLALTQGGYDGTVIDI